MTGSANLASLARAVPSVAASEAPVDKLAYARDLWPRRLLELRAGRARDTEPAGIVWPEHTEHVSAIVAWAAAEGVPLVPYGAGSGVCGGVLPDARTLVVDLKRMRRWRKLDVAAPSLGVEAGAMGITLEEDLGRRGFTAGHFPSSILCSTVGGWVAARGAGQCSGKYGKIEDMVVDLEVVRGDGEVVTLRRRRHGLDLTPLVIGSEGTLGVITAATLRLHEAPAGRGFAAFSFPSVEVGFEALRALFQAGLRPAVSRLYDPFDSYLAKQGSVRGHADGNGEEAAASHRPGGGIVKLVPLLRAPALLGKLVDAVGDHLLGRCTLVLVFEGKPDENAADVARASALAAAHRGEALGEAPARRWLQHRYGVSYRLAPMFMAGAFADTMEVAAPWSCLEALYRNVRRALGKHVFVMAHLSHAYPDGCSIYFTFAAATKDDDAALALYDATWRAALDAAIESGGTISHHHGVGRSKAPRMGKELGAGVDVVRALMRASDPAGILNPGNLLPDAPGPTGSADGFTSARRVTLDEVSSTVTAPATTRLGALEETLAARGFTLGLPGSMSLGVTVGAWLAAGAPGARDAYEDPVDHAVAGLHARLPSGRTMRVRPCPRRAVGPDLATLFLGAGGRFGALVDATLRVEAKGATRARALAFDAERDPPFGPGEEAWAKDLERAVAGVV